VATGEGGATLLSSDTGRSWLLSRPVSGVALFGVDFADTSAGVAVGTNGCVMRTADGGAQWTRVGSGPTQRVRGLAALGPWKAWAVGDAGLVMTTDDGVAWRQVAAPAVTRLDAVSFAADGRGCAVGPQGLVIRTPDGGATWDKVASPTGADLLDVDLRPDGSGWAVGGGGAALRTSDGGATWGSRDVVLDGDLDLRAVRGLEGDRAVAVGGDPWGQGRGVVASTSNGGASWLVAEVDVWGELRDVVFTSPFDGCAVGGDYGPDGDWLTGVVLRTWDGGASWARVAVYPEALQAVAFVDALHGWAAGGRGALLRTVDGGTTWQPVVPVTATGTYALASGGPDRLWLAGGGGTIIFTAEGAWVDPLPAPALPKAPRRQSLTLADLTD